MTRHCPGGNSHDTCFVLASSSSAPACTASRPPTTSPSSCGSAALGSGADIVVLEKATPGAGATGIACGVVRNNYFQPAMSELMQACVEVWESDPEAYHYNGGRLHRARRRRCRRATSSAVFERQERIGYRSELIVGEAEVDAHMKALFPDWRAQGRHGLPARAPGGLRLQHRVGDRAARQVPRARASRSTSDVEVTGFELGDDDIVTAVETKQGRIDVGEQVVIAPGPWAKRFWAMLGAAADDRHPHAVGRRRRATSRCGRTGTCRRARSRSTR